MKTGPLSRSFDEARYRLTREIRENPLLCVGIALGVGAVIGALGSRAATSGRGGSRWIEELADSLGEEATRLGSSARRAGRHAGKELEAVLEKAAEAAPDLDVDHLVRRGRRLLRSVLG